MTDEQLDAAARMLCEIRGWEPETRLDQAIREVVAFYQVAQALDSVFKQGLQ